MKPIIKALLAMCAAVLLVIVTAPSEAAETERYPTIHDLQDIIYETMVTVSENEEELGLLSFATDDWKREFVLKTTLATAYQWGEQNNVKIMNVHIANLVLMLDDFPQGGKYWLRSPYCSDPEYREMLTYLFPDVRKSVVLNFAYKVDGCRLEAL